MLDILMLSAYYCAKNCMWKDYFSFTVKERRGILILCFFILVLIGLRILLPVVLTATHSLTITRDSLGLYFTDLARSDRTLQF